MKPSRVQAAARVRAASRKHARLALALAAVLALLAPLFRYYVNAGGQLAAMRPDAQLAPVLGLAPASGTTAEGYLLADPAHPVGAGITAQTLQLHGAADHYTLAGATSLATLYTTAS